MKVGKAAVAVLAAGLLAGCSSTSSKVSAQNAAASTTAPATVSAVASSTASTAVPSSLSSTVNAYRGGSDKPVAALLKHSEFAEAAPDIRFSTPLPKGPQAWISAVSAAFSDGSTGNGDLNSVALVDEAAKTEDLPSLRMLCFRGCDRLAAVLPAKDASGRTGYQRLSELLEKTHAANGYTNSASDDYPGFTAKQHGTLTAIDKQDMKLLGVSGAQGYTGLRTGFEMNGGGEDPTWSWDGLVPVDSGA